MLKNHKELINKGWTYRPSNKFQDTGIYYRYEMEECHVHGFCEHIRVYGESKHCSDTICRECARRKDARNDDPPLEKYQYDNRSCFRNRI